MKSENKKRLDAILTYHVAADKVMANDVAQISSAKTVNGKADSFKVSDVSVMNDCAEVVATNIETRNGVIHVIDRVILP